MYSESQTYNMVTYLKIYTVIVISLFAALLTSCSTSKETVEGDHVEGKPIYFRGEQVGVADWSVRRVEFSATDYMEQDIIREEIKFDGNTFLFEFIMEGDLQELRVIRFRKDSDKAMAGSSYSLTIEDDRVVRDYLGENAESIITSEEYREPAILQNTQELFSLINTFIRTHYFRQSEEERQEAEMPSLGYDIIAHDRL